MLSEYVFSAPGKFYILNTFLQIMILYNLHRKLLISILIDVHNTIIVSDVQLLKYVFTFKHVKYI